MFIFNPSLCYTLFRFSFMFNVNIFPFPPLVRLEGSKSTAGDDSDGSEIVTERSDHYGKRSDSESEIVTMLGDRKPPPKMVSLHDTNTSIR